MQDADITQLLEAADAGQAEARAALVRAAYDELYRLASASMRQERQDHTLTATALVHEVSVRMLRDASLPRGSRGQFFAYAAKAMRHVLVDYARRRASLKRGGGWERFELNEAVVACQTQSDRFLALHESLERLTEIDTRKASVVELRYFGGLSMPQVAETLEVSQSTAKRMWTQARAWLLLDLEDGPDDEAPGLHDAELGTT